MLKNYIQFTAEYAPAARHKEIIKEMFETLFFFLVLENGDADKHCMMEKVVPCRQ